MDNYGSVLKNQLTEATVEFCHFLAFFRTLYVRIQEERIGEGFL